MICVDGGAGLLAALPLAYPGVSVSAAGRTRCAPPHKVRVADQPAVKTGLHAHHECQDHPAGAVRRAALRRTAGRTYPKVACLRDDLPRAMLTCWRVLRTLTERKRVRTTPSIERKLRRERADVRTKPMGVFSDRTSMDRILFARVHRGKRETRASAPLSP